ncbi:MAG: hypothetical protein AAFR61_03660 [Bacteroidota bacterium]
MAKKNLSQAKGVDALFGGTPVKPILRKPTLPEVEPEAKVVPVKESKQDTRKPAKRKNRKTASQTSASKKAGPAVTPREEAPQVFRVNLEGVRKKKVEYTGIRLRKELFDRLSDIADQEKLKSTNSLISIVLEAYCDGYEQSA